MISLKERASKIRWTAFWSFAEKVFVVFVAIAAFKALTLLGTKSDEATKSRKTRYKLDQATLCKLSSLADQIAAMPAAHDALSNAADHFSLETKQKVPDTFATPAEFAVAVERLVDIEIWKEYTTSIAASLIAKSPKSGEGRPDALANADARARGMIAASHALVESAVLKLPTESVKERFGAMYDEDDPMHVMFEILWYASLIIGVLAASYLLLIIFRALPFTSIESYWTERVRDLVNRAAPGVATRSLTGVATLAPLAAALALGGTIIGGTSYATVPGGASRTTTVIHEHEPLTLNRDTYSPEFTFDFRHSQTVQPIDYEVIKRDIGAARDDVKSATRTALDQRLTDTDNRVEHVDGTIGRLIDQQLLIGDLALDAREAGRYSASKINDVSNKVTPVEAIGRTTSTMSVAQADGAALDGEVLAQTAVADERGFWARAFGFTNFQVTPAVVDAFRARLGVRAVMQGTDESTLIQALIEMEKVPPLNYLAFGKALAKCVPANAAHLVDEHRRALLRLSALPRD